MLVDANKKKYAEKLKWRHRESIVICRDVKSTTAAAMAFAAVAEAAADADVVASVRRFVAWRIRRPRVC